MASRANWKGHLKWSLVSGARFDPSEFEDRYETALKELIAANRAGKTASTPSSPRPTNVVSVMDALRRSVQAERRSSSFESSRSKAQKRAASRPTPLKRAWAKRRHAS